MSSRMGSPRAFVAVLALLPLLPLGALVARDLLWDYFGLVNTETPQGSLWAWEVWAVAGVCWLSAIGVWWGLRGELRRQRAPE